MMTQDEHLSGAEIKFTIPKERYEEVKSAMSNGSNCCYLVFDRNSGLLLRSESKKINSYTRDKEKHSRDRTISMVPFL